MGKKTGRKDQILIRLDRDQQLKKKFDAIRHYYGLDSSNNINVIRLIINDKYKEILKEEGLSED